MSVADGWGESSFRNGFSFTLLSLPGVEEVEGPADTCKNTYTKGYIL